jgi:cytoskeletal protein CcmA (bactofilin family)
VFSKKDNIESFVGKDAHFRGDITSKGTLRVDGRITGNVEADWLIMGEKSLLKGNARVGGSIVGGAVEGNIEAREVVEIKGKGQVLGDVLTKKLVVAEGGFIQGRVAMQRDESKVVEFTGEKVKEAGAQ